MKDEQIYFSFDIEADGPIPGENSMLSIGVVAVNRQGKQLGAFYTAIDPLPGAEQNQDTMLWWDQNPKAWQEVNSNTVPPEDAVQGLHRWTMQFRYNKVWAAYPAGFDFTFLRYYMCRYRGIFTLSCLDMKTLGATILEIPYNQATKRNFPKSWKFRATFPHHALSDAEAQAKMLVAMLNHK